MADTMEYKCPSCGGALEFDSKSQKLKCPYCGTEMDVLEYAKSDAAGEDSPEADWESMSRAGWDDADRVGLKIYNCQSCGAEIVAEESTGASQCPYCGNNIVMKGAFSGDLKPDYIIPFKKDKKEAKAAYHRHLQGKSFLPGIFRNENHIDEIKGMYVPFWLFSGDVQFTYSGIGKRVKTWRNGQTEYKETELWKIDRSGMAPFEFVPVNGSARMDDALMESIEPFDASEMVPFERAYLAGYLADRYDVNMEASYQTAAERMKTSTLHAIHRTIEGYASTGEETHRTAIMNPKYWYVLYPVWILNTTWRGDHYTFAMNGQTGKMIGNLPVDNSSFWRYVLTRGIAAGVVLAALAGFFL